LATVAALWPVCRNQFVRWDDHAILYQNPTLNPPAWASLRIWWTTPHQRLYTPVAYTIWGLIAWLARIPAASETGIALNPHVFHTANLILHLLTATVAYFLLKRLIGYRWPAAAGALLFAIHPVQVESVAHASGIQGLLSGLFGLTAVLLYVQSVTSKNAVTLPLAASQTGDLLSPTTGKCAPYEAVRSADPTATAQLRLDYAPADPNADIFRPRLYALAALAFVLALLSKPASMTVPILAGVLHVVYLRRRPIQALRFLWLWFVLALPCALIVRVIQKSPRFDVPIPFYDRPLIAGYTLAFYLWKIVFPWRLGIVYPRANPPELISGDAIYYTWLIPAAIAVLLWERRRKWRPLAAAALWFIAALLPVLGLTRFDFQSFSTVADRYLYLPMFGIALAFGSMLSRPRSLRRPKLMTLACALLLAVLGIRTWFQTLTWYDTDSLFRNAHTVNHAGGWATNDSRAVSVALIRYNPAPATNPRFPVRRMTSVRLEQISKRFGDTVALDNIDLQIASGELFFLLGPSGCGKSTLLRLIAGLHDPDAGRIWFNDRDVTRFGTEKRNAVMCFQSYALWPHMTVRENIAFGPAVRKFPRDRIDARVDQVLQTVQMSEFAGRKPGQLSGGQQQRVALARALAVEPACLLLDEPLSNLDTKLRLEMRSEIRRICKSSGFTTIYVTHDQKEALSVADRIAVMRNGRIEQVGRPAEMYRRPVNSFVADFLGNTNLLPGKLREVNSGESVSVETRAGTLFGVPVDGRVPLSAQSDIIVSIRPEQMRIVASDDGSSQAVLGRNRLTGRVLESTFLGESAEHLLDSNGQSIRVVSAPPTLDAREQMTVEFDVDETVILAR
jgi:iron(III) transport system ATP-binding protein